MKKLLLTILLVIVAVISYSQSPQYKGLQINETVTCMDDTLPSCYVKIVTVAMAGDLLSFTTMYTLAVYKNKAYSIYHPSWVIAVDQFSFSQQIQFSPEFTQGDIVYKVTAELKAKLLSLNPFWDPNNLIIDE